MAEITADLIKRLRENTGAGMMDCKKALSEMKGEFDDAVDWLRKKGLAAAQKKAGRVAAEGLVAVVVEGGRGAVVEVNSETDFVARNDKFQGFVGAVAKLAAQSKDLQELTGKTMNSVTSGSRVGRESASKCSRSASDPSCSATPIASERAGNSVRYPSAAT